jgi:hypothetical protein
VFLISSIFVIIRVMDASKYTFATPVRLTKGARQQAGEPGTLGLTAANRLELTLDSGQLIFSVPVALTRRKYESTWGWMRVVVGPYMYRLQFYKPGPIYGFDGLRVAVQTMTQAQEGADTFKAWQQRLEQAAAADDQPVIVTNPSSPNQPIQLPPGTQPTGGFGLTAGTQTLMGLGIALGILIAIGLIGALLHR